MKIRSALLIAGSMLAGILLIAASVHSPASFRTPATPTVQKTVYDLPSLQDATFEDRVASRDRVAQEDEILAAYAAQAAYRQAAQAQAAESSSIPNVPSSNSVGIPADWWPTAICEEAGKDDPNYGWFGIQEWNGFDGYAKAGDAPTSVQLAWESAHGQGPPDAPGQCHGY